LVVCAGNHHVTLGRSDREGSVKILFQDLGFRIQRTADHLVTLPTAGRISDSPEHNQDNHDTDNAQRSNSPCHCF
jgi:hypothetical protein